jgi:glc operon protein GlcG
MAEHLIPIHSSLDLDLATRITDEALKLRAANNLLPLAIALLDAGGNLVSFRRENGCGILRYDIALGKAWGALGMGMATRQIRDRLSNRPTFIGALAAASDGRFIPTPGGVLILNAQHIAIGAIGISGDASDKDEFCAIEAIKAVGYLPEPPEPASDWNSAGL